MKSKLIKSMLVGATLMCSNAYAAFDGDYAVGNWITNEGTGSIDISGAPLNVTLTGGNDGSGTASSTTFRIAIAETGTLSFDWAYSTNEANSFWDPFGYQLSGSGITQLTTDGASAGSNQSGTVSIAVTAGEIFGFRLTTRDNGFGSASSVISNFSAPLSPTPVPVPPSFGLFGFALGGLVMMKRREKDAEKS